MDKDWSILVSLLYLLRFIICSFYHNKRQSLSNCPTAIQRNSPNEISRTPVQDTPEAAVKTFSLIDELSLGPKDELLKNACVF
jgi:hypothetical protein